MTPQDVGLPANGRRRTPGLRREEVAQLAGVGLSWYTWLEQGRDIKPSAQVLDALARVLRLDTAERAHLFHLARVELPLPAGDYPREAPPDLAHFVERVAPYPAYLIGPRTDVLAWNAAATAMLGEPTRAPDGRQNLLWWLFTGDEPRTEQRQATARSTLARFRAEQARRIGDPDFAALVDALDAGQRAVPRLVAAPRGAHRAARHEDHRAPARRAPRAPPPAIRSDEPPGPAPHPVRARRRSDARRARAPRCGVTARRLVPAERLALPSCWFEHRSEEKP